MSSLKIHSNNTVIISERKLKLVIHEATLSGNKLKTVYPSIAAEKELSESGAMDK